MLLKQRQSRRVFFDRVNPAVTDPQGNLAGNRSGTRADVPDNAVVLQGKL